jgi:hypothetical protein
MRRILHRHTPGACDKFLHTVDELLPLQVHDGGARQVIECTRLNAVNKFPRFAFGRYKIKESARAGLATVELQHASREGVVSAKVVEQPGVDLEVAKSGLNECNVCHFDHSLGQVSFRQNGAGAGKTVLTLLTGDFMFFAHDF